MTITFFRSRIALRAWFAANHACERELWVGFYKRATGLPSPTWPESVDEALCVGWIDGIRKSVDAASYCIRFTPRKARSTWSAINAQRAEDLTRQGRMQPAGLAAFAARSQERTATYSYEQRHRELEGKSLEHFQAHAEAWQYFQAQPPWYRRTAAYWVASARKEETRQRRLANLIADSAGGRWIGPLRQTRG